MIHIGFDPRVLSLPFGQRRPGDSTFISAGPVYYALPPGWRVLLPGETVAETDFMVQVWWPGETVAETASIVQVSPHESCRVAWLAACDHKWYRGIRAGYYTSGAFHCVIRRFP